MSKFQGPLFLNWPMEDILEHLLGTQLNIYIYFEISLTIDGGTYNTIGKVPPLLTRY